MIKFTPCLTAVLYFLFLTACLSLFCFAFPSASLFSSSPSAAASVTSSSPSSPSQFPSLSPCSLSHLLSFWPLLFLSLPLSVFASLVDFLSPPSSHRQTSLAAAASICSLFAANGPLVCCVQHHKSHQAGTQAAWLPLNVSQSGQFAMDWWAVLIWEQQSCAQYRKGKWGVV